MKDFLLIEVRPYSVVLEILSSNEHTAYDHANNKTNGRGVVIPITPEQMLALRELGVIVTNVYRSTP